MRNYKLANDERYNFYISWVIPPCDKDEIKEYKGIRYISRPRSTILLEPLSQNAILTLLDIVTSPIRILANDPDLIINENGVVTCLYDTNKPGTSFVTKVGDFNSMCIFLAHTIVDSMGIFGSRWVDENCTSRIFDMEYEEYFYEFQ